MPINLDLVFSKNFIQNNFSTSGSYSLRHDVPLLQRRKIWKIYARQTTNTHAVEQALKMRHIPVTTGGPSMGESGGGSWPRCW